ncbi:hypothetical protein PENTCL1PPCAC_7902, partial [Pristionchus entomophagus]
CRCFFSSRTLNAQSLSLISSVAVTADALIVLESLAALRTIAVNRTIFCFHCFTNVFVSFVFSSVSTRALIQSHPISDSDDSWDIAYLRVCVDRYCRSCSDKHGYCSGRIDGSPTQYLHNLSIPGFHSYALYKDDRNVHCKICIDDFCLTKVVYQGEQHSGNTQLCDSNGCQTCPFSRDEQCKYHELTGIGAAIQHDMLPMLLKMLKTIWKSC